MKTFSVSFKASTGEYSFVKEFNNVKAVLEWLNKYYFYHSDAYALELDSGKFYRLYDNTHRKINRDKNPEIYDFLENLN